MTWPRTFELRVFRSQNLRDEFELFFVHGLLLIGTMQQARWRQLIAARDFRESSLRLALGVSAVGDFNVDASRGRRRRGRECGFVFLAHALDTSARSGCGASSARCYFTVAIVLPRIVLWRFVIPRIVACRFLARILRALARGHELRRDDWLLGAALFQFLLLTLTLALILPVFEAFFQRHDEGEARRCPEFNRRK